MIVRLALNVSLPEAAEAKRSLTRFMDQINQDAQGNPKFNFSDAHKIRLGKMVESFNATAVDVDEFKNGLERLYSELKGGH